MTSCRRRRDLAAVVVALIATIASPAEARSPKEEAGQLFREGNSLYDRGEYTAALDKFQRARALYPSYRIDLNIATVLGDLGRTAEAADAYEVFLERGGALAPADTVQAARSKLTELRAKLGRVTIRSVEGATLTVDGKPAPSARAMYVLPGPHRFEACRPGERCGSTTVTIAEGEHKELQLQPEQQTPVAAVHGGSPATTDARGGSWKLGAGWAAVGLGGASLVTGIVLGAMVSSKSDEHQRAAVEGKTYGELQEIADAGHGYEKAQIATLVVGGVALAAGGGLLLWHYLGARGRTRGGAFVAPVVTGEVQGLVGGIRFH